MQAADREIEIVLDLRIGLGNIVVEADGEIAVGEPAERVAERAEGMRLLFGRLGAFRRHFGLRLGLDARDLRLALGLGLLTLHRLVGLVARLVDRQHLEALDGVSHRADLVLALETGQHDLEIAAGELEHGAADRVQRPGHAPRHHEASCRRQA